MYKTQILYTILTPAPRSSKWSSHSRIPQPHYVRLSHFPTRYGGPTNPLLVTLSAQTYKVTSTNYEPIYSPNSSTTYEIPSGVVAC